MSPNHNTKNKTTLSLSESLFFAWTAAAQQHFSFAERQSAQLCSQPAKRTDARGSSLPLFQQTRAEGLRLAVAILLSSLSSSRRHHQPSRHHPISSSSSPSSRSLSSSTLSTSFPSFFLTSQRPTKTIFELFQQAIATFAHFFLLRLASLFVARSCNVCIRKPRLVSSKQPWHHLSINSDWHPSVFQFASIASPKQPVSSSRFVSNRRSTSTYMLSI